LFNTVTSAWLAPRSVGDRLVVRVDELDDGGVACESDDVVARRRRSDHTLRGGEAVRGWLPVAELDPASQRRGELLAGDDDRLRIDAKGVRRRRIAEMGDHRRCVAGDRGHRE
jgi:hypothetical protein